MRATLILICLLLCCCESGVTSFRKADGGRKLIDCSDSYLVVNVPGSYQCEQFDRRNASAGATSYRGIFQAFNVFGTTQDGTALSLQGDKTLGGGYYSQNADFSYERSIKNSGHPMVQQAQNWSALKVIGGTKMMSFIDSTQRQCFAFFQFGGFAGQGYDHTVHGVFCRKSAVFTDDEVARLLSNVVVRDSLSSPLPPSMVPKPLLTCALRDGSSFVTANERGCVQRGGRIE